MYRLRKAIDISVTNTASNEKQFFRQQTSLQGVLLKALVATTFVGNGTMTAAFLQACKVYLVDVKKNVVIDGLPLYLFDPKQNANGLIQEMNLEFEIDWEKSYVVNPNFASTAGTRIEVFALFDQYAK